MATLNSVDRYRALRQERTRINGILASMNHLSNSQILAAPHRPLFLAAFLCAAYSIAWWPLGVWAGLPEPAFTSPVSWHVHELLFGFVAAAIGGYILTALPSWTGRPALSGAPLLGLVVLWLLARVATANALHLPMFLLLAVNAGYFLGLGTIILSHTLKAGNYRKSGFAAAIFVLGCADALFTTTAMTGRPWQSFALAQSVVIGLGLLMLVVGSRAVPAFTNNWLLRHGMETIPGTRLFTWPSLTMTAGALVLILVGWPSIAHGVLIGAGLAVLADMRTWRTLQVVSEPLLITMHMAFLWLPVGLIGVGLLWFFPSAYPAADALHAITIGAFGGLIMAIAGRAAAERADGHLKAGPSFVIGCALLWLATCTRLAAPLMPEHNSTIIALAGVAWCVAWLVFIWGYLSALIGPVARPVLSGKKVSGGMVSLTEGESS